MLLLWDVPLNRAENYQGWSKRHPRWLNPLPDNRIYMRQGDEQYLWMECVRKKFPGVDLLYPWQLKFSTIPLSEALLTANFAIVTNEQAGIKLPDRFITNGWPTTCYHSRDWPRLTELYQREGNTLPQFVRCLRVYGRLAFLLAGDLFKSIPRILPFMWRKLKNFLRPCRYRLGRKLLHLPEGDPPPPAPVTEIPVIALGDILGERRPVVTLPVMRYEDGMLPSAEALALLAILAAERPREVLEIGTYMGHTAKLMAECVETAVIHTVDLPENFSPQDDASTLPKDDLHLIQRRIVGREFKNLPCAKRIRQHFADTATWDFLAAGHPDFFFIDGSHTYEHCLHDSEKCLAIAARPAVFLWHDCDETHPGVAKFILEWRKLGRDIRRVAGTPIAYWKHPGTPG